VSGVSRPPRLSGHRRATFIGDVSVAGIFLVIDTAFFVSNTLKIRKAAIVRPEGVQDYINEIKKVTDNPLPDL
jgi:hypothetical protein